MAIQRCPYCKAIIDEGAEYCTNCGTKLLFPEDEFIEEEIPGEKIIDVDEDLAGTQQELVEKEETEVAEEEVAPDEIEQAGEVRPVDEELPVDEEAAPAEEEKPAPKKKSTPRKRKSTRKKSAPKKAKKEEPVKLVEDTEEEPEKPAEPEEPTGSEADVFPFEPEYIEDAEPPAVQEAVPDEDFEKEETRHGLTDDLPDGFAETIDEAREKAGEPLEEFQPEAGEEAPEDAEPIDEKLTPEPGTAEEKEWQTPPPEGQELKEPPTKEEETVQTGDIEDIVDEAEKEKEEIEDFISSIKKERNAVREHIKSDTQDIPPWAVNVGDGPLPDIPPTDEIVSREESADEEEETEAADVIEAEEVKVPEEEPYGERTAPGYDTRSAFPETVDQQGLPFVKTAEIMGEDIEEEALEEEPKPKKIRVRRRSRPVGFGDWVKARIFDVVFVSALWFVALWISSQVLGISVFRVISGSTPVALAFLAVLLLIYFFFFLYFLGDTLGNYLFSSDD
ncbi:MAG: zinc ribbon domain-containing protein [Proteobacteria bacterium]|nr:zinc ribbon domain-containing protein [Pseudomonadota bacterium]